MSEEESLGRNRGREELRERERERERERAREREKVGTWDGKKINERDIY